MVCLDCSRCKGKPPLLTEGNSPEAIIQRVVGGIEQIVRQINSGQPFDWNQHEYYQWRLTEIWRDAEIQIERQHKARIRIVFESLKQRAQ